jgi:hypothetical protein
MVEREVRMRKRWVMVGVALLVAVAVSRLVCRSGGVSWERMLERMPDTAPPKWMFRNIEAIRQNTDRILERLESRQSVSTT